MKFCPKCGAQVSEGAKFCPKCGNALKTETMKAAEAFENTKALKPAEKNEARKAQEKNYFSEKSEYHEKKEKTGRLKATEITVNTEEDIIGDHLEKPETKRPARPAENRSQASHKKGGVPVALTAAISAAVLVLAAGTAYFFSGDILGLSKGKTTEIAEYAEKNEAEDKDGGEGEDLKVMTTAAPSENDGLAPENAETKPINTDIEISEGKAAEEQEQALTEAIPETGIEKEGTDVTNTAESEAHAQPFVEGAAAGNENGAYDNEDASLNDDDYILPDSSKRPLTSAEVSGLSKEELRLARNEIYARHGRKFDDDGLRAYFEGKSWYRPTVEADSFSEDILSQIEKDNIKLIQAFE